MKLLTTIMLTMAVIISYGQQDTAKTVEQKKDTVWTFEGQSSLNFTQGFLENWSQGGENFLSTLLLNDYTISYDKKRASWENSFNYKLGGTQQGDQDMRKTEDIFEFNSKFGYDISNRNIFFSNIINFKTQFLKGFDYGSGNDSIAISRFLNPGHLVVATGFEYKYDKILSAMISPLSGKATFMTDTVKYNPETFGIDGDKNFRAEMGAYIRIKFKKELIKNVSINTSLELFNNYFDHPENIDIDWQSTITFKANDFIKTVLFTHFVYDQNVSQYWQVKETLGIGIAYSIK
ncbi:MAG TPA: DUF3078 domain-containing protein [Salinivirga sp.]|uniref:DUF3078 domain-containing protein n=1 Tax=Salinivirga sp. TaxID=1970192 RepID=UPI002B476B5F|nr:DUF3078 domain-containing protein [Salinivirga sp.]HKK58831.1 DUF3078 domain-containing protein [Salinivirga sp.]